MLLGVDMVLSCECGNETEFYSITTIQFIVDAEGNREEKLIETTNYFCMNCSKEVFMGD